MNRVLVLAFIALCTVGCVRHAGPIGPVERVDIFALKEESQGRQFKLELAAAIRRADRIVVTEHSYELDAYDVVANRSLIAEPIVYATRETDARQRRQFARIAEQLAPTTQDAFSRCDFAPHHTVRFYEHGTLVSTMQVCFLCAQLRWDAPHATPPWAVYPGLAHFFRSLGLQPHRDWRAAASEHLQ